MSKKGLGRGLGKGLEALIPSMAETTDDGSSIIEVKLEQIEPNQNQPRKYFDSESLDELARSISEHGVIQPMVVRKIGKDRYQLIVGERRWRACRQAGIEKVPVIIKEWDEQTIAEVALIENIQRQDLNPIEEALAYRILMDEYNVTQDQLAKRLGKSRSYIANTLRLLHLAEPIRSFIAEGKLTAGHGKVILSIENIDEQKELAERIVEKGWSVRRTEEEIRIRNTSHGQDEVKTNLQIQNPPVSYSSTQYLTSEINPSVLDQNSNGMNGLPTESIGYPTSSSEVPKSNLYTNPDPDPNTNVNVLKSNCITPSVSQRSPELVAMEERLRSWLQTQVRFRSNGSSGVIEIYYYNDEDLQRLYDNLIGQEISN
ncbi:ParB/RepB/Spo0J family partition protein [Heliobacterium mobile]|uniref:ParB/RepB/Spo0J family partition protein n=1 Tax=Heliobacterium mobile TaxID=28064 RepID=UPI0014797F76|nr:ParB/RepB/Spo0J family partition protein [Heliobacterium mobile]